MTQMTPIARGVICVIVLCICVICGSTQAGQRLATMDNGTGVFGLWGVSTWTAAGQLYYSMTPETATGPMTWSGTGTTAAAGGS